MGHKRAKGGGGVDIPGWALLLPCLVVPVVLINVLVAWLGDTRVPALSFDFLETKARALGAYGAHLPECVLDEHPPLEPLIGAAERRHGIPPGLLQALIQVESEKRVHRISPAGAMGPGQLMPDTAELMRVHDPFDPAPAIEGSARYLAEQLRRFDDVKLAVAAYNAGPGSVRGRVPHNGETEFYVAKVMKAYARTKPPPPVVKRSPLPLGEGQGEGRPARPAARAKPQGAKDGPRPAASTKPTKPPEPAKPVASRHGSPRGASVNRPTSSR